MSPTPSLSDTARAILTAAAERTDQVATPPERLPIAGPRSVVQSLLKTGLLEEIVADDDQPAWRTTDTGERLALLMTAAGQQAIGVGATELANVPPSQPTQSPADEPTTSNQVAQHDDAPGFAKQAGSRTALRVNAMAIIVAWTMQTPAVQPCPGQSQTSGRR